jgi:hypothetical protein
MSYSEKVEKAILDPEIYAWGKMVRKGIDELKMSRLMTTRLMLDFTELKAVFLSMEKKWEFNKITDRYFSDWPGDDVRRIKEWIIRELETMAAKLGSRIEKEKSNAAN